MYYKILKTSITVGKQNQHFDHHLTGSQERTHTMMKMMSSVPFMSGTKLFLMVLSLKSEITSSISPPHPPENDRKFVFFNIWTSGHAEDKQILICVFIVMMETCLDFKT